MMLMKTMNISSVVNNRFIVTNNINSRLLDLAGINWMDKELSKAFGVLNCPVQVL